MYRAAEVRETSEELMVTKTTTAKPTAAQTAKSPAAKTAKPKTTATAKPMTTAAAKPKAQPTAKPKAAAPSKEAPAAAKPADAEPASLAVGAKAPNFNLTADDGSAVSLSSLAGKNVVLYFYPKDDTPGCTREACSFQENIGAIKGRGAVVIGVSRDSAKAHTNFKNKYGLSFPLLVDADASLHKAYGAWGKKVNYGKESIGAIRSTVIIDKNGKIAKVFPTVKVDGHTDQVLAALDGLK